MSSTVVDDSDAQDVCDAATTLARTTHAAAIRSAGVLPPCRNLPPLDPPLALREYEMMEEDEAKYVVSCRV
jgi:hypothetical protein